jgi:DtxR family Mn-dependent transcriptional regulator
MYLITVAAAEEEGLEGPLPLATLADALSVSPVSANEMIWKLVGRGLVGYHPYHGVVLTEAGRATARRVLRGRRLWDTFLVDHLRLTPSEADLLSCRLEHVTPPELAGRLDRFLGEPGVSPLGRPIPPGQDAPSGPPELSLLDVPPGVSAEVVGVHGEPAVASFLAGEGLSPGVIITIEGRGAEGSLLVTTPRGLCHLGSDVARCAMVRLVGQQHVA